MKHPIVYLLFRADQIFCCCKNNLLGENALRNLERMKDKSIPDPKTVAVYAEEIWKESQKYTAERRQKFVQELFAIGKCYGINYDDDQPIDSERIKQIVHDITVQCNTQREVCPIEFDVLVERNVMPPVSIFTQYITDEEYVKIDVQLLKASFSVVVWVSQPQDERENISIQMLYPFLRETTINNSGDSPYMLKRENSFCIPDDQHKLRLEKSTSLETIALINKKDKPTDELLENLPHRFADLKFNPEVYDRFISPQKRWFPQSINTRMIKKEIDPIGLLWNKLKCDFDHMMTITFLKCSTAKKKRTKRTKS